MAFASRRGIAIGAGGLAVLLGALDTYVVVSVMNDIMKSVDIPINQLQRVTPIVTCYLLGYIAAMPLLGRLSDRLGRRLVLQLSLLLFAAGSVVTALSDTVPTIVVGRIVQGVASGALLPVTLALAADLWSQRRRAAVLGWVGAAQELGSVLGPVVGVTVVQVVQAHVSAVAPENAWRVVFWANVPLAVIAGLLIQFSVPKAPAAARQRVDLVGGVLLAVTLALAVIGLYNPEPDGVQILPPHGGWILLGAVIALLAFVAWERRAKTRLIDPAGMRVLPFLASCAASVTAGAALMVTLVDVELLAQGVLGKDARDAVFLLVRFLIALPIGAVIGGFVAARVGDRAVAVVGLLVAAAGYVLISDWPTDVLAAQHRLGPLHLPVIDTDLAIAGLGLGLVIGPLSSAALRAVPVAQAGIASALLVVARMTGMLVGVAALTAFGLYRFDKIMNHMPSAPDNASFAERLALISQQTKQAFSEMYGDIFLITAIVCLVGALFALFIAGRHQSDETPLEDTLAPLPSEGLEAPERA
ncbi:MFS transporter [Tsukamurella soli]|uniref:MFS transporter n=1 Tax=Tsukamurella soli TaxID=644556 RepID=A0ABP8KIN7_9ACTN